MGHQVSIGGNRLGSGNKLKAYLHNYERSTHDLSYVWRSTMACGTLVPFMNLVALPGDTFDINLNVDVLTHPTIGPLFGTYKVQLDVFQVPVRLYQAKLHMNMLGIGRDMSKVALPQVSMTGITPINTIPVDNQQVNPSSIWAYLGIRGVGVGTTPGEDYTPSRQFNAIPYLGYWDIYKNYYANKQEEIGAVIHRDILPFDPEIVTVGLWNFENEDGDEVESNAIPAAPGSGYLLANPLADTTLVVFGTNITNRFNPQNLIIFCQRYSGVTPIIVQLPGTLLFDNWVTSPDINTAVGSIPNVETWTTFQHGTEGALKISHWIYKQDSSNEDPDQEPSITTFPLENIDKARQAILSHMTDDPFIVNTLDAPYVLALQSAATGVDGASRYSKTYSQEGLALKTYQSDLFNNWISTDWIDGPDGVSEVTKIDTTGGSFTIDELNLSKKIYDMLNRIAISGGSYDDWLDAVYTEERTRSAENPMYMGGLIRNIVFQEVVSNAATTDAPLGTLAGRGRMGNKHKGGHLIIKTDEPSYIMGIVSITPNIDYSQGNDWQVNLKTMNDFHKPALDAIGFQDLSTDQMAWWDTVLTTGNPPTFRSAGKQPAWINYMTAINKVYGNFADQSQQMFMVLNRRYTPNWTDAAAMTIRDLTTYIDPVKFNHIFADTRRDAQNFWVQIGANIDARRKMSAKVMPNL